MALSMVQTTKKGGPRPKRGQIKAKALGQILKSAVTVASIAGEAVGLKKNSCGVTPASSSAVPSSDDSQEFSARNPGDNCVNW